MKPISPYYLALVVVVFLSALGTTVWTLRTETPPDFASFATPQKKRAFFNYLTPVIQAANEQILSDRNKLLELQSQDTLSWWSRRFIDALAQAYQVEVNPNNYADTIDALLRRVDVIPASLALIQAAKESAWGTSRFAMDGYNFFGQHCFKLGCGMMPEARASGRRHEVAKFANINAAVTAYINNLNTHPRYQKLRQIRADARAAQRTATGAELAQGLLAYSERRDDYINEVTAMIRQNSLE